MTHSEKSIWRIFGQLVGGGRSGTGSKTTVEHLCAAGLHQVDPQWTHCPYCQAEEKARQRTSRESSEEAAKSASRGSEAPSSRRATMIDSRAMPPMSSSASAAGASVPGSTGASAGGRRHTIVDPSPPGGEALRPASSGRRLVGILSTFTWSRTGQLFAVVEGRNYVGSGSVGNSGLPCEVLLGEDATLSSAHFLILHQPGRATVSDNHSTNGTFVNGEQIDARGVDLQDNAVIKAGATLFTYQRIRVAQSTDAPPQLQPQPQAPQPWSPDGEDTVM
jgi:hypothetical protein